MANCSEKTVLATSLIFGGLTFLMPSVITMYSYITKWIPEEPDPNRRNQMKWLLIGSALAGTVIVGAGVYYLNREKCM